MRVIVLFFYFVSAINGFLLDSQNGNGQTGPGNQYITASAFLDAKTQQQNSMDALHTETEQLRHETSQLRRDTNQMMNVLAAQLQEKLTLFEQQTGNSGNESRKCEQNYEELLRNYTTLQHNLETMTKQFEILQRDFTQMRNDSNGLNRDLQNLKQLNNIQALNDFQALQHKVQSISSQTHSLSVKERARAQDFIALYNVTIESKTTISNVDKKTEKHELALEVLNQTLHSLEISQNILRDKKMQILQTIVNETAQSFAEKLDKVEHMSNATFVGLRDQISTNAKKVSLTACVSSDEHPHSRSPGYIIKFSDIRSKVGINQLSSFTKNGKFTCEIDGMYLITVTCLTETDGGRVGIVKNNYLLTATFSTNENANHAYSSSTVAATALVRGDNIWIQVDNRIIKIYANLWRESCITIVKVT